MGIRLSWHGRFGLSVVASACSQQGLPDVPHKCCVSAIWPFGRCCLTKSFSGTWLSRPSAGELRKHYGSLYDSCSCPQPTRVTLKPPPKGGVLPLPGWDNKGSSSAWRLSLRISNSTNLQAGASLYAPFTYNRRYVVSVDSMNTKTKDAISNSQRPSLTAGLQLLLTSASCLILANLYYAQPILREIAADIGLEHSATGMIVTMIQIGYVLGLLFLAPLGDTVENRRLVACMTAGAACGLLTAGLSNGAALFMAGTLLIGFFAVGTQILIVFGSGLADDSTRGRVLGVMGAGLFLGIALARPIASLFAGIAGWRVLYLTAGALMLLFSIALHRFLPAVKPAGQRMGYTTMFGTMVGLLFTVPRLIPRIQKWVRKTGP